MEEKMSEKILPLKEMSINEVYNIENATYEVPIYQRNFAWEKDEIATLVQDVYDAYKGTPKYFLGTLVTFHKGDNVYEVIDGQQRLTTIYLILAALDSPPKNKLTYRARKKANNTIMSIRDPNFQVDEQDQGILSGFEYVEDAIADIVPTDEKDNFKDYFKDHVHLVHYQVPRDIDLNHYFEIMNSRGEQLEKHEILKARLLSALKKESDKEIFNRIWEYCSEMDVYIQQKYSSYDKDIAKEIFGGTLSDFCLDQDIDSKKSFLEIHSARYKNNGPTEDNATQDQNKALTIDSLISNSDLESPQNEEKKIGSFQPIIDFPNFLLIVLKLTPMIDSKSKPVDIVLDDKALLQEFDKMKEFDENKEEREFKSGFVNNFAFNLLKAKYLLDNYIVHHSNENVTIKGNPWKLQKWHRQQEEYPVNLSKDSEIQDKLVHLLSMFEVTFTARQRKNYLFYCLLYLFKSENRAPEDYKDFLSKLADKYFCDIYLDGDKLNTTNNTPRPDSFDSTFIKGSEVDVDIKNEQLDFNAIYGDGEVRSKGIPFFVFNYLDYKLWEIYADKIRGKENNDEREEFFALLGCSDFDLTFFNQFYFSRTRGSLEHFYPQANVRDAGTPNRNEINCFGNYAMIGSSANSMGSNWSPKTKLEHYLDPSGKINFASVASIKFMIMMQICKDNHDGKLRGAGDEWNYEDIKEHQKKMVKILPNKTTNETPS